MRRTLDIPHLTFLQMFNRAWIDNREIWFQWLWDWEKILHPPSTCQQKSPHSSAPEFFVRLLKGEFASPLAVFSAFAIVSAFGGKTFGLSLNFLCKYCQKIYFPFSYQAEKRTAEVVGRGGGSGEGEEMQEEDEATLLVLGCLAGGLGVLVLVGLVGGLVVRGRRAGGGGRPNLT